MMLSRFFSPLTEFARSHAGLLGDALVGLPRSARQCMAVVLDIALCVVATWFAFYLRVGAWDFWSGPVFIVAGLTIFIWLLLALRLSIYQSIMRFTGGRTILSLALGCTLLAVILMAVLFPLRIGGVPRTVAFILPLTLFVLLSFSRMLIAHMLVDVLHMAKAETPPRRVLIYGAGLAGTQLAASLRREQGLQVVGFVDDDDRLDLRQIDGLTVWRAQRLAGVIERQQVDEVLLAIPSASRARRREIIEALQVHHIAIRSLPSVANIIDGRVSVSDLREVQVDELLGRDPVAPNELLLSSVLKGKRVLVTGAGGSIGSELCRQIIRCQPRQLVMVDQSEYGLYSIESELRELSAVQGISVPLIAELANVADQDSARRVFDRHQPQTVFHAAAYKHVPLVEANPVTGIRNNVFGTLHCCLAAEEVDVETMILISTDKAVRPTNVMGASKRVCELILQARAAEATGPTFAMVRFGNVLGSSGSVVPRFKAQIAAGGPVTLTDLRITRYFMTIPEAAQLVIQASAMARGGEVFLLDMGEPVKIADLARTMISLSGLTVRSARNPDGDIAIEEVGLRPGEKLYEELLIGESATATSHSRIMCAQEEFMPYDDLERELTHLGQAIHCGDVDVAIKILRTIVPEYAPADAASPS